MAASTPEGCEHDEVHGHAVPEAKPFLRIATRRHDPFDEQESPARCDRLAAVPEGHEGFFISPADDEVRKEVRVTTRGHCLEGIASEKLAARGQSSRLDRLLSGLGESGEIEDCAARLRIRLHKLHHQRTVPTPYVHDRPELSKVVCLDREPVPDPTRACHRSIEQRADRRVLRKVIVERHSEDALACGLPSPYRRKHIRPQGRVDLGIEDDAELYRIGVISPQTIAERCQTELAAFDLVAHAEADQAAQNTLKGHGVDRERSGKLRRGSVVISKVVCEADLRSNVENLSGLSAERRLEEGRYELLRMLLTCHHPTPRMVLVPIGLTPAVSASDERTVCSSAILDESPSPLKWKPVRHTTHTPAPQVGSIDGEGVHFRGLLKTAPGSRDQSQATEAEDFQSRVQS